MRIAIIIFAALVLILVLVFVFILPANDLAEQDELPSANDEAIGKDPEDPLDEVIFPEGLPVYPGAIFISHTESENEDIFEFKTTDSPEEVATFYITEFEARDFEDFYYYYDSDTAEVQVRSNGNLITIIADAVNGVTEIIISTRSIE